MKLGFLKLMGACAAALAIASPASAFTVSLSVNTTTNTLSVGFAGLAGEVFTSYDLFVSYDSLVETDIVDVSSTGQLGAVSAFLFASDITTAGLIRAGEVGLDDNPTVDGGQSGDPLHLFTVQFAPTVNLGGVTFALVSPSNATCASDGNANSFAGYLCYPDRQGVPEPASIALVTLALAGAGFAGRGRRRTPVAA